MSSHSLDSGMTSPTQWMDWHSEAYLPPTDSVLFRLEDELARHWHAGQPLYVEDLLRRQPDLADQTETVLQLILAEIVLRREHGETVSLDQLQERFPRWHEQIKILLDCDRLFHGEL